MFSSTAMSFLSIVSIMGVTFPISSLADVNGTTPDFNGTTPAVNRTMPDVNGTITCGPPVNSDGTPGGWKGDAWQTALDMQTSLCGVNTTGPDMSMALIIGIQGQSMLREGVSNDDCADAVLNMVFTCFDSMSDQTAHWSAMYKSNDNADAFYELNMWGSNGWCSGALPDRQDCVDSPSEPTIPV